jgi:hypothetical protein
MAASTVDKPKIITKWQSELQNDEEGTFAKYTAMWKLRTMNQVLIKM